MASRYEREVGKCERHCRMKNQPGELSYIIVVVKMFSINTSLCLHPRQLQPLTGPGIHKNKICVSVRKECMSCCFPVNSQRQKPSEETAAMCFFIMFDSNLQKRWRKIISLTSRPSNMRTWHWRCKEMFIRSSYKDIKIKFMILLSITMYLVHMIQVKITSLRLLKRTPHLKNMNFISIPTISQGYSIHYHKNTISTS